MRVEILILLFAARTAFFRRNRFAGTRDLRPDTGRERRPKPLDECTYVNSPVSPKFEPVPINSG